MVENLLNIDRFKKQNQFIFLQTKHLCTLVYTSIHFKDHWFIVNLKGNLLVVKIINEVI